MDSGEDNIISLLYDSSFRGAVGKTGGCFLEAILHSEIVNTVMINVPITIAYIMYV